MPSFTVKVVESAEEPGGVGESGTVSAAPALGNAIFAATGMRLRKLPFDRAALMVDDARDSVIADTAAAGSGAVAWLGKAAEELA